MDYAIYQEIGTNKMPAHPFLKPAVLSVAADIPKIVKTELQDKNFFLEDLKRAIQQGYREGKKIGDKITTR